MAGMKERHKIIDLFCGAGGFTLGAHDSGFHSVLAIDVDKDVTASFKHNFIETPLLLKDISHLKPNDILSTIKVKKTEIAGIVGGPPCQGFSYIGRRQKYDERNSLIKHFFRIVAAIEPTFFVMENVPGILTGFGREILDSGIDLVYNKYKILGPLILDAADFGAATVRRRVFIIGCRQGNMKILNFEDINISKKASANVYNAIHDLPKLSEGLESGDGESWAQYSQNVNTKQIGVYAQNARKVPSKQSVSTMIRAYHAKHMISGYQKTNHTQGVIRRFSEILPGEIDKVSKCKRLSWDSPCTTLRAGTGKDKGSYQSIRPIHPDENRVISVREAARIQDFLTGFNFIQLYGTVSE